MMMVAVVTVPVVPVVRRAGGIAVVPIRSVVSIWIIAISVRIAVVVTIPIGRITKPNSYASNSD